MPRYAGQQHDADVAHAKAVLRNLANCYPEYKDQDVEVNRFVDWQGDQDQNAALAGRHELNLVHRIKSLQNNFQSTNAKFHVATGCGNRTYYETGERLGRATAHLLEQHPRSNN